MVMLFIERYAPQTSQKGSKTELFFFFYNYSIPLFPSKEKLIEKTPKSPMFPALQLHFRLNIYTFKKISNTYK